MKAFSRVVAVISYLRFDSDSLGSMVVNSSIAHNLRCTGVATFRAKRIGLDQYEHRLADRARGEHFDVSTYNRDRN
jgi:hypothetical protein